MADKQVILPAVQLESIIDLQVDALPGEGILPRTGQAPGTDGKFDVFGTEIGNQENLLVPALAHKDVGLLVEGRRNAV